MSFWIELKCDGLTPKQSSIDGCYSFGANRAPMGWTKTDVRDKAVRQGWIRTGKGKWLCPNCVGKE